MPDHRSPDPVPKPPPRPSSTPPPWIELPDLGFRLDVSRILDPAHLSAQAGSALRAALGEMERLEAGAIANPDEHRQVGHYWLRDPARAPEAESQAAVRDALAQVKRFAARVLGGEIIRREPRASNRGAPATGESRFRHFLLIGIGGSALGPEFLDDALSIPGKGNSARGAGDTTEPSSKPASLPGLQAHFLDNTDPDGIERTLSRLGAALAETLIIVISKSGGTKETRNGMLETAAALERRGLRLGAQAVAVTMPGSKLEALARAQGFLEVFPIWDWVGGRTSIFSCVGLLPAALQGFDVDAFLAGAREMDAATRRPDPAANPAAMLALAWHTAGEGHGLRDMVVLPYRDRLLLLSRYLQQIVMESIGKELDLRGTAVHQGLVVYGNKGSTDQHAFVQQLREGPDNFFVTFIHALRDRRLGSRARWERQDEEAPGPVSGDPLFVEPEVTSGDYLLGFLLGTRAALSEKGRGSLMITLPDVSERSLGALIALYERAVGLYASLIGVNAYHQPGVEAGKQAAGRVLELQRRALAQLAGGDPPASARGKGWTAAGLAAELGLPDEAETLFHLLEHLAANGRIRSLPGESGWEMRFTKS